MDVRYEWAKWGLVRCKLGKVDWGELPPSREASGMSRPSC